MRKQPIITCSSVLLYVTRIWLVTVLCLYYATLRRELPYRNVFVQVLFSFLKLNHNRHTFKLRDVYNPVSDC